MKVSDIIMSAPMVRACIREVEAPGTGKTMTRRLAWNRKKANADPLEDMGERDANKDEWRRFAPSPWQKVQPGDRLWVRENFSAWSIGGAKIDTIFFPATPKQCSFLMVDGTWRPDHPNGLQPPHIKWTPSIHMPRVVSRLTLVVSAVKVERLQDISHQDAVAEGMGIFPHSMSAQKRFRELWAHLHDEASWDANPEVVAVTFKPYLCNIDRMKESA